MKKMIRISEDYETIYMEDETLSDDNETTYSEESENVSSEYETIITPAENISSFESENLSSAARSAAGVSPLSVNAAESGNGLSPEGGVYSGAHMTSLLISVADDVESSDIYNEAGYTAYVAYYPVNMSGNVDGYGLGMQLSPGMKEQPLNFASYNQYGASYAIGFYTPVFSAIPSMCQDYVTSSNKTDYYILSNTLINNDNNGSTEPVKVEFQKGCRVLFTFPDGSEYVGGNNASVPTPTPEITPTPTPEITPTPTPEITPTPTISPEVPSDIITAVSDIKGSVQFGSFMVFVSLLFVLFRSFIRSNK